MESCSHTDICMVFVRQTSTWTKSRLYVQTCYNGSSTFNYSRKLPHYPNNNLLFYLMSFFVCTVNKASFLFTWMFAWRRPSRPNHCIINYFLFWSFPLKPLLNQNHNDVWKARALTDNPHPERSFFIWHSVNSASTRVTEGDQVKLEKKRKLRMENGLAQWEWETEREWGRERSILWCLLVDPACCLGRRQVW